MRMKTMPTRLPTTAPIMLPMCGDGDAALVAAGDCDGVPPPRIVPELVPEEVDCKILADIPATTEPSDLVTASEEVVEVFAPDAVDVKVDEDERIDVEAVEEDPVLLLDVILIDVVVEVVVGGGFSEIFCDVVVVAGMATCRTIRSKVSWEFPAGVPRESASFLIVITCTPGDENVVE